VAKLFSLTWIVEDDSDQLKYVGYCSLFEKLERRKGVPHARRAVPFTTHTRHTYFCVKKSRDL
jgi:hypothetical protein